VGQDLERKLESLVELVLPLLGEIAGANDPGSARRKRSGCHGSISP